MLDNNVFVSALRRDGRKAALRLIRGMLADQDVRLVANPLLLDEMMRYLNRFSSPTALTLYSSMLARTMVVETEPRFLRACVQYLGIKHPTDLLVAATALQEGAVLVTNDRHFDELKESGVVEVLSMAQALKIVQDGKPGSSLKK